MSRHPAVEAVGTDDGEQAVALPPDRFPWPGPCVAVDALSPLRPVAPQLRRLGTTKA